MSSGDIKVAEHDGVYVIRMEGDVRLTLCLSFDEFIEGMFEAPDFCSVMFDLSDAVAIDSTTLGLMAKISIKGREMQYQDPTVVSSNPSITRLLASMGFEDIFNIVDSPQALNGIAQKSGAAAVVLNEDIQDERSVQARVLEAHKLLMAMNDANHDTFRELVDTLENGVRH